MVLSPLAACASDGGVTVNGERDGRVVKMTGRGDEPRVKFVISPGAGFSPFRWLPQLPLALSHIRREKDFDTIVVKCHASDNIWAATLFLADDELLAEVVQRAQLTEDDALLCSEQHLHCSVPARHRLQAE